ncbi:MAG TPA: patatin-like phospholipase family protein, partial [Gemmatimonadales bacterium]|nr:patatin-like phospholipase family protein [Gemmatimonadales bacterium]
MNRTSRVLLRIGLALSCFVGTLSAQAKPFQRALVLTGGGFKFMYEFGVYDALVDRGWKPDVIITTCGAAVVGAVIHGVPDRTERLAVLQSPAMLEAFRAFKLKRGGFRDIERLIRKLSHYQTGWQTNSDVVPDLFSLTLFDDDSIRLPFWQKSFADRGPDDPHIVVVGATAAFSPHDVETPRKGRKLYEETYFTDPEIAKLIEGFKSPIGQAYPNSAVSVDTKVFTDFSVGDAASISIRDPFLMKPLHREGQYFTGGNIDLYPLELARHLASEVVMTFNSGMVDFELLAIDVTLGYNMNDRLRTITGRSVDHWVDATGIKPRDFTLDPTLRRGFPKLFEVEQNYPRDQHLPMTDSNGRPGRKTYVVTAEMEFMRRALVAYDRGY